MENFRESNTREVRIARRGEIYRTLNIDGSYRYNLVVSSDVLNESKPRIMVVNIFKPTTPISMAEISEHKTRVLLTPKSFLGSNTNGDLEDSIISCESIYTTLSDKLDDFVGLLKDDIMEEVSDALTEALDLYIKDENEEDNPVLDLATASKLCSKPVSDYTNNMTTGSLQVPPIVPVSKEVIEKEPEISKEDFIIATVEKSIYKEQLDSITDKLFRTLAGGIR